MSVSPAGGAQSAPNEIDLQSPCVTALVRHVFQPSCQPGVSNLACESAYAAQAAFEIGMSAKY